MILGSIGMAELDVVFLAFCRVAGILVTAPIFQSRRVPAILKVSLAALLAGLLAPVAGAAPPLTNFTEFGVAAVRVRQGLPV